MHGIRRAGEERRGEDKTKKRIAEIKNKNDLEVSTIWQVSEYKRKRI